MSHTSIKIADQNSPILVFGRDGQVGRALQVCLENANMPAIFLGRDDCDLTSESSIVEVLSQYQPQVIINAAAYTAVDLAESEVELALNINRDVPALFAQYMAGINNGILIHFSTDYVFSDSKKIAYTEDDLAGPAEILSAYGRSKLLGEQQIQLAYQAAGAAFNQTSKFYILRTSWVYGNGANFIRTIWNLAHTKKQLHVVNDQIGVPTSADWLAKVCESLINKKPNSGIYHAVPDGAISWFDLAKLIVEYLQEHNASIPIKELVPISAKDYPTAARRPYNSRLNNRKLKNTIPDLFQESGVDWENQVINYLDGLNEKHN
jgi:dTDP-4-dehydrorhamnose reductase